MASAPYSLVIRDALIVDGTGRPGYGGDLAVSGDRIAAVGHVDGAADQEIDAQGKVLAPGFIDIHTHYDPQLCWDRTATPSPEHGVTSLIMGNCSISLAPVRPADRRRVIHLFGSVEDMEGRLLESTIPFGWETVPQYLDYLRGSLGPNVGMLIGHSVLRLYAMGADAQRRAATPEEAGLMCAVLAEGLDAGAFGMSITYSHLDEDGGQLPCHYAERGELLALMRTMADHGRGLVEVSPQPLGGGDALDYVDLFAGLSLETGVTCTLSPILHLPMAPARCHQMLDRFVEWRARGAPVFAQTQTRPLDMTIRLDKGSVLLGKGTTWRRLMGLETAERIAAFADPSNRDALFAEASDNVSLFDNIIVRQSACPGNREYLGRSLREIADTIGRRFSDVLIDIALADDLSTEFGLENFIHADTGVVAELLNHPAVHIGSGDAGAHITSFAGAGDTSYLFERFVHGEQAMSVERAVQRLTSDIARDWRITDRGELAVGKFADLVLFDPARIARGPEMWVEDVPGGSGRYVRHPQGIEKVIVNGQILVDAGTYTGNRPGVLI
jgi:N-acyl-D-amino-acid deacylase